MLLIKQNLESERIWFEMFNYYNKTNPNLIKLLKR